MRRQNEKKLKWLLEAVLPGRLVDTPTLERHGITRMLAHKYIDSGWLEPVVRGLYRRPQADVRSTDWQLVVRSLQHVMDYSSVVGGRTALRLQGFAHYLTMGGDQDVHLYGEAHPTWLKRLDEAGRYRLHSAKLFDMKTHEETTEVDSPVGLLKCLTPERAILELLDELPKHESVHIVDTAFEGLASARPRRLEKLLASCTSIKVKRLFFVFADKHGHAWRRHLLPASFLLPDVILHNRITARKPALVLQSVKDPLGRMALLTVPSPILQKPLIYLLGKWIQLRPVDGRCPAITGRLGIGQHLTNAISANPKLARYLSSAKPVLKVRAAHT